jgi:hypothetical protein
MKTLITTFSICLLILAGLIGYNWAGLSAPVGYSSATRLSTPINAATATTTTSSAIGIEGAKRVTLFLDQDLVGIAAGLATTTFAVTVSTDDSTYITYNKLIDNVTNANSQELTRVASKVVGNGTDYILSLDLGDDVLSSFKITATKTGAGLLASTTITAKALIEF